MSIDEMDVIDGELIESESGSGNRAVAAQNMMQVRGSYATAVSVQNPREPKDVLRRLKQEAELAGESFYYGWGAGQSKIEGPSVGLAVAAARCWGNCAVEQLPMQETPDAWVFTSTFVDLETGFTMARQFRQAKRWQVHGKHDPERKDDIRFQIGQSKAARNVILKAIPEWMIDQAMAAAKAGVRDKIERFIKEKGIVAAVDAILKALAKVGVTEAAVLDKCGVAAIGAIDVDNMVILRGDLTAIQNGQERAETLFPKLGPQPDDPANKNAKRSALNDRNKEPDPESTFKHAEPEEIEPTDDDGEALKTLALALEGLTDLKVIEEKRKQFKGLVSEAAQPEVDVLCDERKASLKGNRGEASNKKQTDLLES